MNWYCLHTRPQREAYVDMYCRESLGLETYLPRLRQQRTIRRVRRITSSPLFPRYLFARFDLAHAYRAVRYAPEVLNIVHCGALPAVVDEALIRDLQAWAGPELDIVSVDTFQPGDPVRIVGGPLQGLCATILRTSNEKDRVTLLLSAIESAQVNVRRSDLEKVAVA